jgi:hypothetical protein
MPMSGRSSQPETSAAKFRYMCTDFGAGLRTYMTELRTLRARMLMRQAGMFTCSAEGCPWSCEDSRLGALTVNRGLPSLAYSRPLQRSFPARRRSGGCVIGAGPGIRYPGVAACEQYQVSGGDDAGEVDDELEG